MDKFLEFTGNNPLLVSGLLISFFIVVIFELRRKAGGMINVETSDAVKLINNDAVVIDLRSAESFGRGHIVNARNVTADEVDTKVPGFAKDKSKPVIAVCDSGMSSTRTVNALRKLGYESAYGLKGGMNGWVQEGLPVVTGKKTKSKGKGKSGKGKKRG
ncbi:MAG: rhodanese-like domain-containing protein [Woeseiaceae bacterium]|jgi:rhodanese-related sulfurtransferase